MMHSSPYRRYGKPHRESPVTRRCRQENSMAFDGYSVGQGPTLHTGRTLGTACQHSRVGPCPTNHLINRTTDEN
jgi:hypothetical protein